MGAEPWDGLAHRDPASDRHVGADARPRVDDDAGRAVGETQPGPDHDGRRPVHAAQRQDLERHPADEGDPAAAGAEEVRHEGHDPIVRDRAPRRQVGHPLEIFPDAGSRTGTRRRDRGYRSRTAPVAPDVTSFA
ncbi:hypothetical protein [Actinomycetospora chiangmaiensis]|uniref:hypothetical protein n=1 Tax=Actinomycetospora chiangmaiensis TaxID=402650 RepID=UPI001FE07E1A|nr:hypothetical protein [Actinomycetospora chiangmaiensis]